MLIIEIVLIIFAWRNGWRWYSLVPIGVAFFLGVMMGIGVGASGGDVNSVRGIGIFLDICAIIALIVMVARKPKSIEDKKEV